MAESGIGLRSIPLLLAFAAGLAEAAGQSNRIENLVQLLGGQVGAFAGLHRGAGEVVQHQHVGIGRQRTCDLQAFRLAARQGSCVLADHTVGGRPRTRRDTP